jgi:two-component system chemotaxis sensor kinase CheA
VNPAGILDGLRELGEMIRVDGDPASLPPLAEMDPGRVYVAFTCWLMSRAPRAEIETCFEFADEPGAVSIDDLPMDDAVEAAVVPCLDQAGSDRPGPSAISGGPEMAPCLDIASADRPGRSAISGGPEMAPCLDIASADRPGRSAISGGPEMAPALPQARTAEAGSEAGRPAPAAERRQADRRQGDRRQGDAEIQSIRVATDKVDRLVNLVGELIITQSMIAQTLDNFDPQSLPRLREAVAQMDRHSRDLQERVMAVRMLPIKTVFGRFSRVVRDLAQSLGKRVQFETEGEETELDKTVIERISDPLTHLVRNAVDHGIESPADRVARGKPEAGHLTLAAYQQGGNIFIEIREDGQGLDRDRILAKALELGLVTPGESLTDEQIHALIFRPGFSTAREVTGVSGRGVGMDVVRRNVEALGGAIAIHSVRGQGTTFRIKLPLTLAILEGQLLRVGREVYVLPLVSITESVRPTRDMIAPVLSRAEAFIMRGEVLPLLRLHRVFQVPGAEEEPTRGLTVVVETDGRRAALLVDELLGQQQVVIKSLEVNFEKIDGVSGATILGDGRVALILDVPGLVGLAFRRSADPGAARAA